LCEGSQLASSRIENHSCASISSILLLTRLFHPGLKSLVSFKNSSLCVWANCHKKQHGHIVKSDAIKFLEDEVAKGSYYDLVYIDDWHAYEHVKKELELIDKLTDKKSIILLHDLMAFTYPEYHLPMEAPVGSEWSSGGPTRAVFELDKDKWEFCTIPVNNGLTILRKK
jgi:predicted O-methyltransferase YrrM